MKKIIASLALGFFACCVLMPTVILARENITDWYIKDFNSEIRLNSDSSLDVTEKISADCGNLPDKHGIFRVLPEFYYGKDNQKISAPIKLLSIKDEGGKSLQYSTIKDRVNDTVTWKIGDPNTTVTGVNNYEIKYQVKNVIRQGEKDELYWNLNGNFWDIQTDQFHADLILPSQITQENSEVNIYSGSYGEKNAELAKYSWNGNTIEVDSTETLATKEGITLSVIFPDGITAPYIPTFWERYGPYFFYLIPIFIFYFCLKIWRKYGRDPKDNPTIVPEFGIPDDLSPMEMGMVYSDGTLKNNFISASIINLAVNGYLKIEEIPKKGILGSKDYKLILLESKKSISYAEKNLIEKIFGAKKEKLISEMKNHFYTEIPKLSSAIMDKLSKKKLLYKNSKTNQAVFAVLGSISIFGSFFLFAYDTHLGVSVLLSGLIIIVFSFVMSRRTEAGLKLFRRVQGFKLYMETAEKYRQQFNEKENIFEKFLPYAIMFGMTKQWINKMKDIYGEKYFANYHPVWFYGYAFANFDVNSLNSAISDMSSNMASTISSNPSSSGAGGGGFSGGGGGGGGGGGW